MEILGSALDRHLEPPDDDEHAMDCPLHPDAPEEYECGGIEEHLCSLAEREVNGCSPIRKFCECPVPHEREGA